MKLLLLWLPFVAIIISPVASDNPYEVLGVPRSASQSKIKTNYKRLAREWHPDKNTQAGAQDKFVKINEAYQILSDSKRKEAFDMYGVTDEQQQNQREQQRQQHQNNMYKQFHRGPSGSHSFFFDDLPFGQHFHQDHSHRSRWNQLNQHAYSNIVKPDSYHKVFLIGVFGDFCLECMRVLPIWDKTAEQLSKMGVTIFQMHYENDPHLAMQLGVSRYPSFVGVIAGRPVRYKSNEVSVTHLRDFVESLVPASVLEHNLEDSADFFSRSFEANKPQCLLFSRHDEPPILFKLVAFEYHLKVAFAYANTKNLHHHKLMKKYGVHEDQPTVVMLKEEPSTPVLVSRGSSLKHGVLRQIVTNNMHLEVPRMSVQYIFDEFCPEERHVGNKYCIILTTKQQSSYSEPLYHLRQMHQNMSDSKKEVYRFLYAFEDAQTKFYKVFPSESKLNLCSDGTMPEKLLVLSRGGSHRVKFEWLAGGWCANGGSVEQLETFLAGLASGKNRLEQEAYLNDVTDEHGPTTFWLVMDQALGIIQYVSDTFDGPNWMSSAFASMMLVLIFIIFMSVILPIASEWIWGDQEMMPSHQESDISRTVLGLEKLFHKNISENLLKSPAGQITVVVLLDAQSADEVAHSPITQAFADTVYHYTSNTAYKFMWMSVPDHLPWVAEIMGVQKFGELIPGTVLAMNGFRKYLYVYKPEVENAAQENISAKFMGFEESDDEDGDAYEQLERIKQRKASLLIRQELPRWLEKLMEGMLRDKKRVEEWPRMDVS